MSELQCTEYFSYIVAMYLYSRILPGAVFANGEYSHNKSQQHTAHSASHTHATRRSDETEDDTESSTPGSSVYYHAFPGSVKLEDRNENFTVTLDNGEKAVSVTVGTGWVAVATSRQYLRVFSSTGLQLGVYWLKGPVVALCAHEDQCAVVYNSGHSIGTADYQLSVQMYSISSLKRDIGFITAGSDTAVPLTRGSTLTWLSFSIDIHASNLCIMDSKAVVSMLFLTSNTGYSTSSSGTSGGSSSDSAMWIPMLEVNKVKKSIDHMYWPILIRGNKLAYVLLNGESKPVVFPQPVVTTRNLKIPVIDAKDGKEKDRETVNEQMNSFLYQSLFTQYLKAKTAELMQKIQFTATASATANEHGQTEAGGNYMAACNECVSALETVEGRQSDQSNDLDRTILSMFQLECRHVHRSAQVSV